MNTITVYPVTVGLFNPRTYNGQFRKSEFYYDTKFKVIDDSFFSLIHSTNKNGRNTLTKCCISSIPVRNGTLKAIEFQDAVMTGIPLIGDLVTMKSLRSLTRCFVNLRMEIQHIDIGYAVYPVTVRPDIALDQNEQRAVKKAARKIRGFRDFHWADNGDYSALFDQPSAAVTHFKMVYG